METIYLYVDESFREHEGYWHCSIGGMLVGVNEVVDTEITLETTLVDLARAEGLAEPLPEFKYSSFFRQTTDDFKLRACGKLAEAIARGNTSFLVSHAKMNRGKITMFKGAHQSISIQNLAYLNIVSTYLKELTATTVVQVIVDLGLSEAFRPTYDVYSGALRSIPYIKAHGVGDESISVPNFRSLPPPVFMDSKHSRILQVSDLLVGLLLCKELGLLTAFKSALLERMSPLMQKVRLHSVEWNGDAA